VRKEVLWAGERPLGQERGGGVVAGRSRKSTTENTENQESTNNSIVVFPVEGKEKKGGNSRGRAWIQKAKRGGVQQGEGGVETQS